MSRPALISLSPRLLMVVFAATLLAGACGSDGPELATSPSDEGAGAEPVTSEPVDNEAADPEVADCADADWITTDAGDFAFRIPADLVDQEPQGIDSVVGELSRPGLRVSYDYGWYSPNFYDLVAQGATVESVTTDGRDAVLVTADLRTMTDYEGNLFTALYVAEVNDGDDTPVRLALWIDHEDSALTSDATCIAKSVSFA